MVTIIRTIDDQAKSLANYLPGGKLFRIKNFKNSNFRNLLIGLAGELFTADGYLRSYSQEILPDQTVLFIDEWEKALGIPDDCFFGNGTLDERRRDILVKLASSGIQTAQDFVDLAALFGVSVIVKAGVDGSVPTLFPMTFPLLFSGDITHLRFTIIIQFTVLDTSRFPLYFPFIFGSELIVTLECLFNKLRPANCALIFEQI